MLKNQKLIFLYALIITFAFFNLGIFFGYMIEDSRVDKINRFYVESDMDLLDQRVQTEAFDILELDCNRAIQANIDFADKIFEDARKIQRFEDANVFNEEIVSQHKRFDLFRALFWMNSIKIKAKCNASYHNIVYFYDFKEPSIEQKAEQDFFSNLLVELKEEKGDKIMLIPIAGDNGLISVELLMNNYKIEKLPAILIDEKFSVYDVKSREDVEKYLD